MRPVARRLPSGIALLALAAALPLALGAQSTDTLLSALKLPSRAGFAPLVPPPPGRPLLLRPDRVFDATNEETHTGWAVLVEGDSIAAVGPVSAVRAPSDAETIALPGLTLLPGLIDAHSHLFLHPYNETLWNDQVLKEPEGYRMVEAVVHARNTLMQGFTTLRDLGTEAAGFADVAIKRAIDEGLIPGPRLGVATRTGSRYTPITAVGRAARPSPPSVRTSSTPWCPKLTPPAGPSPPMPRRLRECAARSSPA